jgi:hypothetical protein
MNIKRKRYILQYKIFVASLLMSVSSELNEAYQTKFKYLRNGFFKKMEK